MAGHEIADIVQHGREVDAVETLVMDLELAVGVTDAEIEPADAGGELLADRQGLGLQGDA